MAVNSCSFEQIRRVLDLAFEYLSTDTGDKEKIIAIVEEKFRERADVNLTEIFSQEQDLSDNETEYLRIFDTHLQTLGLDYQFGKLAVANDMATEEAVAAALEQQRSHFKKYRINLKIGDILVENRAISNADRISILLTQNRIEDERLMAALNDIGNSRKQREAVNKRFGALAVRKGRVTIAQVKTALEIQENEREKGKSRFIGEILGKSAGLSEGDIREILIEQKQVEKRRLDLEKAIYTAKSEMKICRKLNQYFEYHIARDGIELYVKKLAQPDENISAYEFLIWLRRVGIRAGVAEDAVLEEFIQNSVESTQILVAKGYPATPGVDDCIKFYFEPDNASQECPVPEKAAPAPAESVEGDTDKDKLTAKNHRQKPGSEKDEPKAIGTEDGNDSGDTVPENPSPSGDDTKKEKTAPPENKGPLSVKKGSLLARIIPGKKGKPGKDVLGHAAHPDKPAVCMLNAGTGVVKKGLDFFARTDGRPFLKNNTTLLVEPAAEKTEVRTIHTPVNEDTKDRYEHETVELNNAITADGILRCRNLLLHGHLVGSAICTGNLDVKGDIGTNAPPGDTQAAPRAIVVCRGSVTVTKSVINSKIETAGELSAFNSPVIGSDIIACQGMVIKDVLTGETPTTLRFGIEPGNKILAVDHTLELKTKMLSVLKKENEIRILTEEHTKELKEVQRHETEQFIFKNLFEIIEAPDLYQHEGLENKISHLESLPDYSSVKAFYLKPPETDAALAFYRRTTAFLKGKSFDDTLKYLKENIDPEAENETDTAPSSAEDVKIRFNANLAALELEVAEKSTEIKKIENELSRLKTLRANHESAHIHTIPRSTATIKIRNRCEKGTIIQGKIARLVVAEDLFNVEFKEILDKQNRTVSIIIET